MYKKIKSLFFLPAASGIILMISAVLGIIIANSFLADFYFSILEEYIGGLSILHWINDGLMAVFFLYVGLELKREFLVGELATNAQRILPGAAAIAGLTMPAFIYYLFNKNSFDAMSGWAIPAATDIAFALGILALLGNRIPLSLKIFLTALAIIDDLAVIVIIAVFYTNNINLSYLLGASLSIVFLIFLNFKNITRPYLYVLGGLVLWVMIFKSGVHATLAGVILALTIPLNQVKNISHGESPLITWEHRLSHWVSFFIIPIFGLANAGVSFSELDLSMLIHPVVLGITLGLFLGKQIGIFGIVYLGERMKLFKRPAGASWLQVYGVALLCGIGFTMSLFISMLAFVSPELQSLSKIGVFLGSLFSGILGYLILRFHSILTDKEPHRYSSLK